MLVKCFCAATVALIFGSIAIILAQTPSQRIVTAAGARVRSGPAKEAAEVGKLPLGAVITVGEQFSNYEATGDKNDFWYRVSLPDGKAGWIAGPLTAPFNERQRNQIYRKLAEDRLKLEKTNFADTVDLCNFLTRAMAEVTETAAQAELEFNRLRAMQKALTLIEVEIIGDIAREKENARIWIKTNEKELVYSEPSGEWLVKSDLFWKLQEKHKALPVAERIAWAAAKNTLPGECEGYLDCYVGAINLTIGRYLELYPNGAHAAEALADIAEVVKPAERSQDEAVGEAKDLREQLTKLKATIAKTNDAKKAAILKNIELLLKRYS